MLTLKNPRVPLDIQMGTGQINAWRAYQQFSAGSSSGEQPVSSLGWDYGKVEANKYQEYELDRPLVAGSHAAITLVWDRLVDLNDFNRNQQYDLGETFRDRGLNNLDVYLLPIGKIAICVMSVPLRVLKTVSNIFSALFPPRDVTKLEFTIVISLMNPCSLTVWLGGRKAVKFITYNRFSVNVIQGSELVSRLG